ncbi:MAG: Spy/CpxP family protein refolding chaperone [bacterium]
MKTFLAIIIILAVLTALMALCGGCFRHKRGNFHSKMCSTGGHHKMAVKYLKKKLDLTDGQVEKINVITNEIHSKCDAHKGHKGLILDEIINQLARESADKEQLNKLVNKKKSEIEEMVPFAIDKFSELHGILTSEQRAKLAGLIKKHHDCRDKACH